MVYQEQHLSGRRYRKKLNRFKGRKPELIFTCVERVLLSNKLVSC